MNYDAWEKYYLEILSDFKFDRIMDEQASQLLSEKLRGMNTISPGDLEKIIMGKHAFIFGGGDLLFQGIETFMEFTRRGAEEIVTISADGVTTHLIKNNILPDIIVTDLDGKIEDQVTANEKGSVVVVHAHGDNASNIKKWVSRFNGKLVGTTQARPLANIFNFGGFTDGDRCVFLAEHFGAKKITLVGFDYSRVGKTSNKKSTETKLKKLMWAKKLIETICKETGIELEYL
ncbi:MAG: 6-hydroxymethylpterin diphosphokinase MptE-like protein [Thermoplasmata archaeon]